jgi:hypothetical protein
MTYRSTVSFLILAVGAVAVFCGTAQGASASNDVIFPAGNTVITGDAMKKWDVPAVIASDVKANTGPVETSDLIELLATSFDDVDTDNNGKVSFAEAQAALPGLTQASFDEVDTNGDGQISRKEADACGGCFGCAPAGGGVLRHLSDLFLGGLALFMMTLFGRRGNGDDNNYPPLI